MTNPNDFQHHLKNIFLLILLIGLAFAPCLQAGFVHWDDDLHLLDNPLTQTHSLSVLPDIFTSAVNKTYIPLTILSFNIEHYFFGLNPFVFHLNNLILHILICLIIYALVLRMGQERTVAFWTALLFAVHPMHVESVAWVTQRKDVLYSLFYVLSLFEYWKHLTYRQKRSYTLSLVFGSLCILAKPMALSLPLTLLVLDWYYQGRIVKQAVLNKIPFVLAIVPVAWITYQMNARVPLTDPSESFLIWAWSATFYIKKFLTPFVLLPLYQLPQPVSIFNPSYASSVLLLIALIFLAVRFRKDRLFICALCFYVFSTFFLWRYDNTVDVTIVGDRFMYLPSLGICLWLASRAVDYFKTGKTSSRILIDCILVFLMVQTFLQCRVWRDDLALWQHELKHEQKSALAYNSYGVALSKRGDSLGAIQEITRSLELRPAYALALYNRGHIYARHNEFEQALADLNAAIAINPKHVESLLDRATIHSKQNNLAQAIDDLNAAEQWEPNNAGIFNNRGIVYKRMGQFEEALKDYNKALKLNPRMGSAFVNRSRIWQELKDYPQALEDLREAERLGIKIDAEDLNRLETLAQ